VARAGQWRGGGGSSRDAEERRQDGGLGLSSGRRGEEAHYGVARPSMASSGVGAGPRRPLRPPRSSPTGDDAGMPGIPTCEELGRSAAWSTAVVEAVFQRVDGRGAG
jgi:hypothetical protein